MSLVGEPEATRRLWIERWLFGSLLLWAVGSFTLEGLASIGLGCCVAGTVIDLWWRRAELRPKEWAVAWAPLIAFASWWVLAPLFAARFPTGTGLARLGDWLALPLGIHAFGRLSSPARRWLAIAGGVAFALSCAVAGLQHFGVWPRPEWFEALAWTRYPFYRVYEEVPGSSGRFMAGGLLSHRLKFAHTGALAVLCAVAVGLRVQGRDRIAAFALAGAGTVAVWMFPFARMASAALAVALVIALTLQHPRRKRGLAIGIALLAVGAAAVLVNRPLRDRFSSGITAQGSGERGELLATGVRAVRANPIVGIGLGQFRPAKFATPATPQLVVDSSFRSPPR